MDANRSYFAEIWQCRRHVIVALIVFLAAFLIYNATKAPTVSFWDCGEFITCSHGLGVPHPPGTPLFVEVGRIFSLLPFISDPAARINLLSALCGALAAAFAFLVTFRLIRLWWSDGDFTGWKMMATYFGALVGASMAAFGNTQWNNCIETEVYAVAMFLVLFLTWVFLVWVEKRSEPGADKFIILLVFVGLLSTGFHMTTFLFLPALFVGVILLSERLRRDYRLYISCFTLYLIAIDLDSFLIANGLWLAVLVFMAIWKRTYQWCLPLILLLAGIIGFSSQLYIPIRASQNPTINMGNPTTYTSFRAFLERKQYGDQNMVMRAFTRRASWLNQLGNHERMGFWGFFNQQYGINGRPFAVLFVLGLLGMYELVRRQPRIGWPFVFLVFLGTLFLVWYMNFADGTRIDSLTGDGQLEVRDRDYFWTPGFMLFGMAIGLGVAGLMEMMRESLFGRFTYLRKPAMILVSLLVLLTMVPVKANYFSCDRSQNFTPYDFAYNILQSCDPNAILFVGGDNDTYPVWCVQGVYGVRPDITVINLSLANLPWYIFQIRDRMKVPLDWTDEQIMALRHHAFSSGQLYRIQDQVAEQILNVNRWERPIDYSISAGTDALVYKGRSLMDNVMMQGMIYRLYPTPHAGRVDIEKSLHLYLNTFKFRSLADSTIYKDAQSMALTTNYTTGLELIADSLARVKRYDDAIGLINKAISIVPYSYDAYAFLAQLYVESGREQLVPGLLSRVPHSSAADIYYAWGSANKKVGNRARAREIYGMAVDSFPHDADMFREYSLILYEDKDMTGLRALVKRWLEDNPNDDAALRLQGQLNKTKQPTGKDS